MQVKERLDALTSLRFFAAMMIVIYHSAAPTRTSVTLGEDVIECNSECQWRFISTANTNSFFSMASFR